MSMRSHSAPTSPYEGGSVASEDPGRRVLLKIQITRHVPLVEKRGGVKTLGQQIDETLAGIQGPDVPTKITLDLYPKDESPLVE